MIRVGANTRSPEWILAMCLHLQSTSTLIPLMVPLWSTDALEGSSGPQPRPHPYSPTPPQSPAPPPLPHHRHAGMP